MALLDRSGRSTRTSSGRHRSQSRPRRPTGREGNLFAGRPQPTRRSRPRPTPPAPRPQRSQPSRRTPSTPRRTSPPSSPPQRQPGPVQTVTPEPKPPSIPEFLGADEVYQTALRGSRRELADFLSQLERTRGEAGTQFEQTQESLEEDRVRQLDRMRDEFAARGLIHSGLFGQEQGRFQEAFQEQMQQLEQQQASLLADLVDQETNTRRQQEQSREIARQEALARRANRFDIPFSR